MSGASEPEFWRSDSAGDAVTVLDIPASLSRRRVFHIDVSLQVKVPSPARDAWHQLRIEVDGRHEWTRQLPSHSPGQWDGLDYHLQVGVEAQRSLRIRAVASTRGSQMVSLRIEAMEALDTA